MAAEAAAALHSEAAQGQGRRQGRRVELLALGTGCGVTTVIHGEPSSAAVLLVDGRPRLLLDAGYGVTRAFRALLPGEALPAVYVTHNHSDHAGELPILCAMELAKRHGQRLEGRPLSPRPRILCHAGLKDRLLNCRLHELRSSNQRWDLEADIDWCIVPEHPWAPPATDKAPAPPAAPPAAPPVAPPAAPPAAPSAVPPGVPPAAPAAEPAPAAAAPAAEEVGGRMRLDETLEVACVRTVHSELCHGLLVWAWGEPLLAYMADTAYAQGLFTALAAFPTVVVDARRAVNAYSAQEHLSFSQVARLMRNELADCRVLVTHYGVQDSEAAPPPPLCGLRPGTRLLLELRRSPRQGLGAAPSYASLVQALRQQGRRRALVVLLGDQLSGLGRTAAGFRAAPATQEFCGRVLSLCVQELAGLGVAWTAPSASWEGLRALQRFLSGTAAAEATDGAAGAMLEEAVARVREEFLGRGSPVQSVLQQALAALQPAFVVTTHLDLSVLADRDVPYCFHSVRRFRRGLQLQRRRMAAAADTRAAVFMLRGSWNHPESIEDSLRDGGREEAALLAATLRDYHVLLLGFSAADARALVARHSTAAARAAAPPPGTPPAPRTHVAFVEAPADGEPFLLFATDAATPHPEAPHPERPGDSETADSEMQDSGAQGSAVYDTAMSYGGRETADGDTAMADGETVMADGETVMAGGETARADLLAQESASLPSATATGQAEELGVSGRLFGVEVAAPQWQSLKAHLALVSGQTQPVFYVDHVFPREAFGVCYFAAERTKFLWQQLLVEKAANALYFAAPSLPEALATPSYVDAVCGRRLRGQLHEAQLSEASLQEALWLLRERGRNLLERLRGGAALHLVLSREALDRTFFLAPPPRRPHDAPEPPQAAHSSPFAAPTARAAGGGGGGDGGGMRLHEALAELPEAVLRGGKPTAEAEHEEEFRRHLLLLRLAQEHGRLRLHLLDGPMPPADAFSLVEFRTPIEGAPAPPTTVEAQRRQPATAAKSAVFYAPQATARGDLSSPSSIFYACPGAALSAHGQAAAAAEAATPVEEFARRWTALAGRAWPHAKSVRYLHRLVAKYAQLRIQVEPLELKYRPGDVVPSAGRAADARVAYYRVEALAGSRRGHVLGKGGFGKVYFGRAHAADGTALMAVAVKVAKFRSRLEFAYAIESLQREAEGLARCATPHVVRLVEFVQLLPTEAHLVMEYLAGESLHALLRRVPRLPAALVAALARQLLLGLQALHAARIVHFDLSPSNIIVRLPHASPLAPPSASAAAAATAPAADATAVGDGGGGGGGGGAGEGLRATILDLGIARMQWRAQPHYVSFPTGAGCPRYREDRSRSGAGFEADLRVLAIVLHDCLFGVSSVGAQYDALLPAARYPRQLPQAFFRAAFRREFTSATEMLRALDTHARPTPPVPQAQAHARVPQDARTWPAARPLVGRKRPPPPPPAPTPPLRRRR